MAVRGADGRYVAGHEPTYRPVAKPRPPTQLKLKGERWWSSFKGKSHTEEAKAKISAALMGHPGYKGSGALKGIRNSPSTEFKKGLTPWNKGRGENRECKVCGTTFWVENNRMADGKGKFCSRDCFWKGRECKSTFKPGAEHPAYIDGRSPCFYPSAFTEKLKRMIRERDGYACVLCGKTQEQQKQETGKSLCVNHIDFNKENCDPSNLNTLCNSCNTKINWDRQRWTEYFQSKVA